MYCSYYQASIVKKTAWFVVGYFRSEEHLVFERAYRGSEEFEFFVPPAHEELFCKIMISFIKHGYVRSFEKMDNRYYQASTIVRKEN